MILSRSFSDFFWHKDRMPWGSLSLWNSSAGWVPVFSNIFRHTLRFQDVLISQSVVRQEHLERYQISKNFPAIFRLFIIPDCSSFFPFLNFFEISQHLIFIQGVWKYISSDDSKKAKVRGYSRCLCYFVL